MTELYPLIDDAGRLRGAIGTGGDATKVCRLDGACSYYLWLTVEEAADVTSMMSGRVVKVRTEKGVGVAPVASWVASLPYVHARVAPDLDDYVDWLRRTLGRELRGKTVLLGFSGGKDSLAALLVLDKLNDRIDFRLRVLYVHIPFLESPRSVDFVERVASKLGIHIEVVTAPRRTMKTLLKWKGMPRRGYRFCTVYKAKPMRQLRKQDPKLVEVVADRLTESPKRFEKLSKTAAQRQVLVGRKFRPTYLLTLLDVVDIVRRSGLIHPDYLDGLPRVACTLCPYKALYEFRHTPPLEDEELIENVFEKEWRKWYSWTTYQVFKEQRLWRFNAVMAKSLLTVKEYVASLDYKPLRAQEVEDAYRRLWTARLPNAPVLEEPWQLLDHVNRARRLKAVVYVPQVDA